MDKYKKPNPIDLIHNWIKYISKDFNLSHKFNIQPLAGDASIRKYYLLQHDDVISEPKQQFIIMQTPINDSMANFVKISNFLSSLNLPIKVPKIFAIRSMPPYGFLLLNYLGEELLFNHLNLATAEKFYDLCLRRITHIQKHAKNIELPKMDRKYIKKNLILFKQWYLKIHLNLTDTSNIENLLYNLENYFLKIFKSQPQTFVHVDYHSKNIMLEPTNLFDLQQHLGILDFQDAMIGPITYDLVSLLQDAYITLPSELIEKILFKHHDYLSLNFPGFNLTKNQLLEYFYLTGLQRHIKNLGIFARLKYFYHKPNYINYIPNLLNYISKVCELFQDPEIIMLKKLLSNHKLLIST